MEDIYIISAPNTNKIYIGKSRNPQKRFKKHKTRSSEGCCSYELSNMEGSKIETLETPPSEEATAKREYELIREYRRNPYFQVMNIE